MHLTQVILSSLLSTLTLCAPTHQELNPRDISDLTIFTPPAEYTQPGTLYARTTLLSTGTILATWENYSPDLPTVYFPIYSSTDNAQTWSQIGEIHDTVNGWGLRYQPFLYELPVPIGAFPAGTILCAGNSIPANIASTQLDLYASTDGGHTWTFASHIASGNGAPTGAANANVWEPFLMTYNDALIVYFSDQRDPAHNQKIVHQTSPDGISWSLPIDDIVYPAPTAAPGMATVAKLPNASYMMTYEYGGDPEDFAVYYRIGPDPTALFSAPHTPLIATDGTVLRSSPYVVWSPYGGNNSNDDDDENGTIVVNAYSNNQIFTNENLGDAQSWKSVPTTMDPAYSRSLLVLPGQGGRYVLVCGAGMLPPEPESFGSTARNDLGSRVAVGVVDLGS